MLKIWKVMKKLQELRKKFRSTTNSFTKLSSLSLLTNLQRQLLAKQNRSWEFDLEEGMLDCFKVVANYY